MVDRDRWQPGARAARTGLLVAGATVLTGALLAPGGARSLDIESVTVLAGPARVDGVLEDYFLEVEVEGSGIAGVTLSVPGADLPLSDEGGGLWRREDNGFDSLADIRANAGFGTFTLVFEGTLGETDEVDLFFDPGDVDLTGFPTITFPDDGATDVSPDALLTWSCTGPAALCQAPAFDGWFVELTRLDVDEDLDDALLFDPSASSWSHPGSPILAGVPHEFNVAALRAFDLFEPEQTDLGDEFEYASAYWSENSVVFAPSRWRGPRPWPCWQRSASAARAGARPRELEGLLRARLRRLRERGDRRRPRNVGRC